VPEVKEITAGMEVFQCKGQKWWDYDPATKQWGWTKPPPVSQKPSNTGEVRRARAPLSPAIHPLIHLSLAGPQPKEKREKRIITLQQRLLKEFGCKLCGQVLTMPLTMLCAHSFCKARPT